MKIEINHIPLGITEDNGVYYGRMELRENHNGDTEFSASFDLDYPTEIDDDWLEEQAEQYYDNYGKDFWEERFGTSDKDEIIDKLLQYEDLYDNSCFPIALTNDSDDKYVVFLAGSGGQHDAFDKITKYLIPKKLVKEIQDVWNKYHLSVIDTPTKERITNLMEKVKKYKLSKVVIPFIEKMFGKYYHQ